MIVWDLVGQPPHGPELLPERVGGLAALADGPLFGGTRSGQVLVSSDTSAGLRKTATVGTR